MRYYLAFIMAIWQACNIASDETPPLQRLQRAAPNCTSVTAVPATELMALPESMVQLTFDSQA